jgi:ribonuclease HI
LKLIAYCDGSGNSPRGSSCAAVVCDAESGEMLAEKAKQIWICSNNIAEYMGVLLALQLAKELHADEVEVRSDSQVVVNQVTGEWEPKDKKFLPLRKKIWDLASSFTSVSLRWIPREKNERADFLCGQLLEDVNPIDEWRKRKNSGQAGPGHTSP